MSDATNRDHFEVIIIGCGIAGASLAYFLAEKGLADVLLVEREAQPAYHTTGRSAASLVEWDPIPALQELKAQGARFFRNPPANFSQQPLLRQNGILVTFQEPAWSAVKPVLSLLRDRGTVVDVLTPDAVLEKIPVLSRDYFDGGVFLPEDGHLDVHELLWSYLRQAGRRGVQRRCGVGVGGVTVEAGRVRSVVTTAGELHARWIVNAAGAWAGQLGVLAGAAPIELTPRRRTIITFPAPADLDVRRWPLVANESHQLYFSPESGGLLASPMDEDPMEPCDATPDDLAVAEAVARLTKLAPRLAPKTLRRTWAGLRTFAPDRVPVVGEDPFVKGFFWLAGQGGCGIETSPAVGAIAADLLLDSRTERYDASLLAPTRLVVAGPS